MHVQSDIMNRQLRDQYSLIAKGGSMSTLRGLAFLFFLFLSLAATAAPPATETSAVPAKNLQELRRQLASSDIADRQTGQKTLESLMLLDLDALRALAKDESDPEVKTRLEGRIDELTSYVLTHPKGLSLHVKKASVEKVAAELQRQLGPDISISASGSPNATYTFNGDNLPFWRIMAELNKQFPLKFTVGTRSVRLTSSAPPPNMYSAPCYVLVDTFLITLEFRDDPNLFPGPDLRVIVDADPRVGIIQYSYQPHITKITDQNGNSLPPSIRIPYTGELTDISPPTSHINLSTHFDKIPDIKSIKSFKDLQATIDLAVLEKEKVHTIDLTKPLAPVTTPHGTFIITQNRSSITVSFTAPARPVALNPKPNPDGVAAARVAARRADFAAGRYPPYPLRAIPVRVFDKDHKLIAEGLSGMFGSLPNAPRGNQVLVAGVDRGDPRYPLTLLTLNIPPESTPKTLEITLPESFRPYVLPIDLHDVPIVPRVIARSTGPRF
jgi:hypothetical protein